MRRIESAKVEVAAGGGGNGGKANIILSKRTTKFIKYINNQSCGHQKIGIQDPWRSVRCLCRCPQR